MNNLDALLAEIDRIEGISTSLEEKIRGIDEKIQGVELAIERGKILTCSLVKVHFTL
jgi:hypothetical protein